jgi:hypothetical protein
MATYFLFGKYSSDATKNMSASRTEKANKLKKSMVEKSNRFMHY